MMYVKKPIPVEAIKIPEYDKRETMPQWMMFCAPDWFIDAYIHNDIVDDPANQGFLVTTLEGAMLCPWGSYIIRGVKGELYPCRGDIFEETYMPID